ncbi:Hint domain-containing protein [Paracoccus sp. TOH]|uniref:Hint domain-containing protein n=1 Tax=Paracoccus sp. TOH TaxID=1263728 RepID=UPI0025B235EB|nr:Hint domain-containing protein [Paracoccus sp. TOH]WJS85326.1 Hint domain-containing protein [Paracoccus sp. TOH]
MPSVNTIPYVDLGSISPAASWASFVFDSCSGEDAVGKNLSLPSGYQPVNLTLSSCDAALEYYDISSERNNGTFTILAEDTMLNGEKYPAGTDVMVGYKLMVSYTDKDGARCVSWLIPIKIGNRGMGFGIIGRIPPSSIDLHVESSEGCAQWDGRCAAAQIPYQIMPGVAAGTMLETERGLVAIEDLVAGNLVLTRDHGLQHVRWIGSRKLCTSDLRSEPNLRPIRFRACALGKNIPASDLLVSPQHRILIRSRLVLHMFGREEFLAPAKQLLRVEGIDIATDLTEIEYFQFLFDRHEIVISNGAETESLYASPEILKTVGHTAREEIFTLFPNLRDMEMPMPGARMLASGTQARKLVARHRQKGTSLVS